MADIKWIKLTTDMFDNRKIKQIRHLPEGNSIVLIWVMLLTIAGRCNASGMIFLTENIPYTLESLAVELDFEQSVVKLALDVLQKFGMIVCTEEAFYISNWEEYQNIEGMEKIREQTRQRVAKHRENKKLLASNVTCNATVTQSNATEIDIEEDKELRNKNNTPPKSPSRGKGEFVPPTLEEIEAYCKERGNSVDAKYFYDYFTTGHWKDSKGNPVRNWKQKLITWERGGYGSAGTGKQPGADERARKAEEIRKRYEGKNFFSD